MVTDDSTSDPSREDVEEKKVDESDGEGEQPPTAYPEGGLAAWLTVFGGFTFSFCTFGMANAWGVFQSYYALNQLKHLPPSTISWIGSVQLFLQFAMGILSGPLFDRGYFRHMMISGSILFAFGIFMTSLSKTFWQLILCQGLLVGISSGLLFIPSISLVSHYFLRKRALAMGLTVVGSSVGGVCWPIFINRLFESQGYESAVRSAGYLLVGLLVIANLAMQPRLPGRKKGVGRPRASIRKILSNLRLILTVLGGVFVATGLFFPVFYLQVFIEAYRLSPTIAFYGVSLFNAGSVFGRTLPNLLADRFGAFNVLLPCCFSTAILVFALFGTTSNASIVVFAVMFGFTSGAYISIISPAIASLAVHIEDIGSTIGLAFVCVGFGPLVSGPIAGALLAKTGGKFYAPIIFAGTSILVGVSLLATARTLQARYKGTWKV